MNGPGAVTGDSGLRTTNGPGAVTGDSGARELTDSLEDIRANHWNKSSNGRMREVLANALERLVVTSNKLNENMWHETGLRDTHVMTTRIG